MDEASVSGPVLRTNRKVFESKLRHRCRVMGRVNGVSIYQCIDVSWSGERFCGRSVIRKLLFDTMFLTNDGHKHREQ